jgi:hypothetical protein
VKITILTNQRAKLIENRGTHIQLGADKVKDSTHHQLWIILNGSLHERTESCSVYFIKISFVESESVSINLIEVSLEKAPKSIPIYFVEVSLLGTKRSSTERKQELIEQ